MVDIRCLCPPKADGTPRHNGDHVELRPRLGFTDGNTIRHALGVLYLNDPEAGVADVLAVLQEHYVLHGIESWTLVDEKGEPLPVTRPNIRAYLLTDQEAAEKVADAADELYREAVMAPLLRRASTSSPPTPTDASTSAPNGSSEPTPAPSSPSSTTTTPTDDTETTSSPPASASSTSPSLASVG